MLRTSFARISTCLIAALSVALLVSFAHSEDKPAGMTDADKQKMMEAYMQASQPGEEHSRIREMAGTWDAQTKAWMPDGTECGTGKGVMKSEMILGGRYLQMDFQGEMESPQGKMPYHGMGICGYDKGKKKFFSTWIDDMSTGMMVTSGTMEGNVCTGEGEMTDPVTGQTTKVKDVATKIDDTHHKYELHMSAPDGKMYKAMEITSTQRAS